MFFNDIDSQGLADDGWQHTRNLGEKLLRMEMEQITEKPMFVFGKPVQGGVSGITDLSEATSDNNFQIETVQHDYRETFSTLYRTLWVQATKL